MCMCMCIECPFKKQLCVCVCVSVLKLTKIHRHTADGLASDTIHKTGGGAL